MLLNKLKGSTGWPRRKNRENGVPNFSWAAFLLKGGLVHVAENKTSRRLCQCRPGEPR